MTNALSRRSLIFAFFSGVFALFVAGACNREERPRCERCGMFVDAQPRWRAGAVAAGGRAVHFDAPRCLFAWLRSDAARGSEAPWVTEYYAQRRRPAAFLWYVAGSDVTGPMGPDLIPLDDEAAAQRFREEHRGTRVLRFDAIDAATLDALDAR